MPEEWRDLTVAAQEDVPTSTLALFRSAVALRPRGDSFAWLQSPSGSLVFDRGGIICLVNVDAPELELPPGELLLASEPGVATSLPPSTAAWVRRKD
jgi:alpha-glucosidase